MTRYQEMQKVFKSIFLIVYYWKNEFHFAVILMFENLMKLVEAGIVNCLFNLFRNFNKTIQREQIGLAVIPKVVKYPSHKKILMRYY